MIFVTDQRCKLPIINFSMFVSNTACAEWIYQYNMCKKYENHFLMFLTEKKNDTIGRFKNSKISENQNIDIDNKNNNGSKRNNENILMRDISSSLQQDIIRNDTHLSMEVDAQIHLVRYKNFDFLTSKVVLYYNHRKP